MKAVPRILLVDDDPDQLELRRLIFEREGYEAPTAATIEDAVRAFRESKPEAVLMDLRLPDVERGLQLIRALRNIDSTTPICVLSGWTPDLEAAPERKLVQRVLQKPVRSETLVNLARALSA